VRCARKRATNPVQRSELCRMPDMDFGEYPFHALR
jgi:hypothetical protein